MNIYSNNKKRSSFSRNTNLENKFFSPQKRDHVFLRKLPININKPEKQKVLETYLKEFNENFQNILIEPKVQFIKNITTEVDLILNEVFQNKQNEIEELSEYQKYALEKLDEEYEKNLKLLSKEWSNYIKNPKNYKTLTHFRKHCIKTNDEAYHPCETEKAKLIEIKNKENEVTHAICIECKKCYKSDSISLLCNYCKIEYYSCVLPKNSDPNILPATWEKYHCGNMINETMKCIKCQNILYYNLNERYLVCLNKKCNFRARPESMIWNCVFCKKEFKSDAKIYNPMEMFMIKRAIRKALLFKEPSFPSELPCCKINPEELVFYHKDECKGELYRGNLNRNEIVVCSKCRAMNFVSNYIWICPLCHRKFRSYKSVWGNLFKKKEYLIDDEFNYKNRNEIERYGTYDNNDDNCNYANYNRFYTTSNDVFNSQQNLRKVSLNFFNSNLSKDFNKNESKGKKKQYKTLLDLIEERNNQNRGQSVNKNNENKKNNNNNLLSPLSQNDNIILFDNDKDLNEITNVYSTNEGSLSGNSNQTTNKIKIIYINSDIKSKNESSQSILNINQEKESGINQTNSRKSIEIDDMWDKINILETLNNNNKKNPQIETNFEKKDSLSSIGELTSVASITPSNYQNIISCPEKIELIGKEGKIPEFDIDDYIYLDPIGEGSYGKIYLVENTFDKKKYALKKIICNDLKEIKKLQKQIELVYSKSHPNIMKIIKVQYKSLDITTYSIYILMELANSDWNNEIRKRKKKKLIYTEKEIINIIRQITNACLYLENEGIAHRDIKPQNILLFENNIFKIADFGEAKSINDVSQECTLRGSELYMSPILYNGLKFNQKDIVHNAYKSDVFSFGFCILYALTLNLQILNEIRNIINMTIINNIVQRNLKKYYSKNLINLILNMLELNENDRFSFNDIKKYLDEKYK